jgi:hypothetical protein
MPLVDSRQQMLDLGELLKVAAENTKSEYPMEFVYAAFVKEVQMPDSKLYRYGNTSTLCMLLQRLLAKVCSEH